MKKIIYFSFIVFLSLFYTQTFSQTTTWTVQNQCDCSIQLKIVQNCNGTRTSGSFNPIANGGWGNITNTTIYNQPTCDGNCNYTVVIKYAVHPPVSYSQLDVFCCQGPLSDCVTNDCVQVKFDVANCTVELIKPLSCP